MDTPGFSHLFLSFSARAKILKSQEFSAKIDPGEFRLLLAGSILIKSQNATILETLTVKVFSLHSAWKFKNHNDFHVILLFTGNQVAWGEDYVCIIDIWVISLYKLTKLGGNNPLRLILQPFPPLFLPIFFLPLSDFAPLSIIWMPEQA